MRFKDRICIQGYYGLERKRPSKYHIAHYDRGRGARMYLCGCHRSIRIGNRWIHPGKSIKMDGFHYRSKFNIGRFWKE